MGLLFSRLPAKINEKGPNFFCAIKSLTPKAGVIRTRFLFSTFTIIVFLLL